MRFPESEQIAPAAKNELIPVQRYDGSKNGYDYGRDKLLQAACVTLLLRCSVAHDDSAE